MRNARSLRLRHPSTAYLHTTDNAARSVDLTKACRPNRQLHAPNRCRSTGFAGGGGGGGAGSAPASLATPNVRTDAGSSPPASISVSSRTTCSSLSVEHLHAKIPCARSASLIPSLPSSAGSILLLGGPRLGMYRWWRGGHVDGRVGDQQRACAPVEERHLLVRPDAWAPG